MNFLKKYWYLLLVTVLTVVIGVVAYLTSTKLQTQQSVAPTVPQATPKASGTNSCQLVFAITPNTPTPSPTGPADTPTPSPTNGPTATPTSGTNQVPECTGLTLSPDSGTPSFTTTITCSGKDVDGDITAVEFTLPDGSTKLVEKNVGSPGSLSLDYTVTQNGTFSFSCRVRDNNFVFSDVPDVCKTTMTIGPTPTAGPTSTPGPTPTLGPSPTQATPKIPVSGGTSVLGASTVAGGILLLLLGLVF